MVSVTIWLASMVSVSVGEAMTVGVWSPQR